MNDSDHLLAAMPVPRAFFKLAAPAAAAQLINILYNLVDKIVHRAHPGGRQTGAGGRRCTTPVILAISAFAALQAYGGDMAVASMSILSSVMQFVMLLLPGLVQGAQPLLSYNPGAENIPRVKRTFRLLLICCVSGSFLIWLLCMSAPGAVAAIFTNDAALIAYTIRSMRIYLAALLIYGVQVACQYSFVALDQAPKAIFLTI